MMKNMTTRFDVFGVTIAHICMQISSINKDLLWWMMASSSSSKIVCFLWTV